MNPATVTLASTTTALVDVPLKVTVSVEIGTVSSVQLAASVQLVVVPSPSHVLSAAKAWVVVVISATVVTTARAMAHRTQR